MLLIVSIFCILAVAFAAFQNGKLEDTIFVSIASYRDAACSQTIASLFKNADHPQRVWVGLCQQNDATHDQDCAEDVAVPEQWRSHVRTIRVRHLDAQGPTWARYLCSTLLRNERFYLQVDSHSLFARGWDTALVRMIQQLKRAGVRKPLLSHYPPDQSMYDADAARKRSSGGETVTAICRSKVDEGTQLISFDGAGFVPASGMPRPSAFVAGGMLFGEARFVREVPYDPHLPYLFVGEEILHTVRLWTHGWDIFTPSENTVYHFYERAGTPKVWVDTPQFTTYSADAVQKVRKLLKFVDAQDVAPHLARNLSDFGLGTERSLEQYMQYSGIDPVTHQPSVDFCKLSVAELEARRAEFAVVSRGG